VEKWKIVTLKDIVTRAIMANKLYGILNLNYKESHIVKIGEMWPSMTQSQLILAGNIRKVVMLQLAQKPHNQLLIVVRSVRRNRIKLWMQMMKIMKKRNSRMAVPPINDNNKLNLLYPPQIY
jgi:hypothetical protein